MCGITGHISLHKKINREQFSEMTDTLRHRGPDGKGIFISENGTIALGHRRLSFLDLSDAGAQPMCSNNKNTVITFNGEIYNYLELKEELKNTYSFRTSTDTEVILAGYEKWGIEVVNKLKGMFAFALLDEEKQKLFLVRDRFGIKPLYYSVSQTQFIFASELKAILASEEVEKKINYSAFCDYFVYRYIPSPKTIWKNIFKIPPAYYLEVNINNLSVKETEYWNPEFSDKKINETKLVSETDELLFNSVKQHLRADVPVGSFLSGGYDSSALVYYMNRLGYKFNTFSIGFENWKNSEHHFAKIVADHFEAENEAVIADEKSLDLTAVMPEVYDEPFADISVIPTYMVSQLARKKVKAVLSGEGADEIFGGYTWQKDFFALNQNRNLKEKIKYFFKPYDTVNYYAQSMAMGIFGHNELKEMFQSEFHQHIPEDIYWFYRKHFQKKLSPLKSIQYMDMKCFMGEMVLTKIDRASMFHSLEVRVPFLDHHLYEMIFSLDENCYFNHAITKMPLHEILKNHLPAKILNRQKQGFAGPNDYYANIEWYKKTLAKSMLAEAGIVNRKFIDKKIAAKEYWALWKISIMEKWFAFWMKKENKKIA